MDSLETFFGRYPLKPYEKGTLILRQDTPPPAAFAIKSGLIKGYNLTAHGEEKPISFSSAGEVFPMGWVFGKMRLSPYYYEAFSDCELYSIPPKDYLDFIRRHPSAMFRLLDHTVGSVLMHQMRINALEQSSAYQKVLHTIHFLALSFGEDVHRDVVEISPPFTQQDLANITGLTRETTSLQLKRLGTEGIITYHDHTYVVHTDKLNDLLDDEYEHHLVR